jgi:lipopolysaccharide/colanic/teichoic acid biosynthesis glycosyltransferase
MKKINRTRVIFAVYDTVLVLLVSLLTAWVHDDFSLNNRDGSYLFAFFLFPLLWLILSLITRKFRLGERSNQREVFYSVLFSNFVILSVTTIIMVTFHLTFFSRFILFGSIAGITVIEIITGIIFISIQNSVYIKDWIGLEITEQQSQIRSPYIPAEALTQPKEYESLRESMVEESGEWAFNWIESHVDITDPKNLIISTDTRFNLVNHPQGYYENVVNLDRINKFRRINKFFETVNAKLPYGGNFIGCAETYSLRKQRILTKLPPVINYIAYTFDFLFHRVFPKITLTNKFYFLVTGGKNRVISRTETLGRIFSCGFEVLEEKTIGDLLYWRAQKIKEPLFDNDPTYGFFIHLRRIGKNGKEFNVYKLRTMHAYAEYVQGYVHQNNDLDDGGKFKDDFRVTTIGRVLRKLWLDEVPMFLNILKGEMKLVGVRPLSRHYFGLYKKETQTRRIKWKPGLIPPYYAQYPTPVTLDDIQQNEMTYLDEYEKHHFRTDVKYFFLAMYYILWKRARSA